MQRVLIVEDEEDSREGLRMLLEASGYDVETAADGLDGLAKLKASRPDTAIVDIELPGIDGYQLARQARADPRLRGVRLIALTGYGRDKDRQAAHAAGFNRHFTKPVRFATLREAIDDRGAP